MPILSSRTVVQAVDRDERDAFRKEFVAVHAASASGEHVPLALVRKRLLRTEDRTLGPVLLVHGYGQNRYVWHLPSRSFSNYLARAGFDVFNLDLRGHGRSRHLGARRARDVGEFAWEDLPAAVAEVRALSGGRPVHLVGHSLGGLVSYAAAAVLGDSVAGVASLGSPYHFTRGSLTLSLVGRFVLAVDDSVHLGHGSFGLKPLSEAFRIARVFVESPLFPSPIRGFAPASMEPEILGQHMSLAMDNGSIAVLRNMFRAASRAQASGHKLGGLTGAQAFEALDVPLLVVAGTLDDLAPPSSVFPAIESSRSSDKTYRAFPRGHIDLIVGRDAPQTVWPLVEAWLRTRVRRRSALAA